MEFFMVQRTQKNSIFQGRVFSLKKHFFHGFSKTVHLVPFLRSKKATEQNAEKMTVFSNWFQKFTKIFGKEPKFYKNFGINLEIFIFQETNLVLLLDSYQKHPQFFFNITLMG
jgi:hypothetical protein